MKSFVKRRHTALIAFMLACVMVFALIPWNYMEVNAIDTSKANEQTLKDKLDVVKDEQADLKAKYEAAQNSAQEQERQKEYFDQLMAATLTEIDLAEDLIKQYDEQIEAKQKEIADLQTSIEEKYQATRQSLRASYMNGNASYLEMIVDSESFTDFLMTIDLVSYTLRHEKKQMQELEDLMIKLEEDELALQTALTEQQNLVAEKEASMVNLEEQKLQAEQYMKEYEAAAQSLEEEYLKAKAAEEELQDEIDAILAQRAREEEERRKNENGGGGAPTFGGTFIWPVPSGYSRISSQFGPRTLWGRYDFHLGIDIPASYGTNVFASASGTVVTATYHYSYGYYVLIDHGNGYSTLYAHNSRLCVSVGQTVNQGDVIAKIGSTGSSSGNHLHFELRVNNKVTNPLDYVSP